MGFAHHACAAQVEQEFAKTKQALEKAEKQDAARLSKLKTLEKQQIALQREAVKIAQEEAALETREAEASAKLALLEQQEAEQHAAITHHKKALAALMEALIQLRMNPSSSQIVLPGDVRDGVHTALTISGLTETLKRKSKEVRETLAALQAVRAQAQAAREDATRERSALQAKHAELVQALTERKLLLGKLGQEQRQERVRIDQLRRRSRTLEELVANLSAPAPAKRKETQAEQPSPVLSHLSRQMRSFAAMEGRLKSPVVGTISQRYRKGTDQRPTQQGIAFETAGSATVRAIYDGEVVFAGPFMGYGKLVILRHSDQYHTLVSGLERLDVTTGQFVLEGEPIGAMGNSAGKARLYLELRRNNRPTDPTPWFRS